jgi:ribosome-associated protein
MINTDAKIPNEALEFRFVHASGPGGQHVNKAATAVELRVDTNLLKVRPDTLRRLRSQQRNRINKENLLIIQADQYRSQLKNRKDALERLQKMLAQASVRPKTRIATKPSKAAKERRVTSKKQRGTTKLNRKKPNLDV